MFCEGIPIFYYGTEQGFKGGNDPANREALWSNMDKNHPLYQFTAITVKTRKAHKAWACEHIERFVEADFYAFSRCDVLIATTNSFKTASHEVGFLPWKEGVEVCNVYNTKECHTVGSKGIKITLENYATKVFVPKNTLIELETE